MTFEYFLTVNKLILTFTLKQIKNVTDELKQERREALENYDDELYDDLVL